MGVKEAWAAETRRASRGAGVPTTRAQGWHLQAVLERSVAEVAAPVVRELRLALLAPPELSALEEQNRQEPLIPVRTGNQAQIPRGARLTACCGAREARGWEGLCGDRPPPTGGADRGGVEVPRSAERVCSPECPVPPPEGHCAPGAPPLFGPAL